MTTSPRRLFDERCNAQRMKMMTTMIRLLKHVTSILAVYTSTFDEGATLRMILMTTMVVMMISILVAQEKLLFQN